MNFTVADYIQFATTIIGTLIALAASRRAGKTAKSDAQKTRAETAQLYQQIADKCAETEIALRAELESAAERERQLRDELALLREQKDQLSAQVEELRRDKEKRVDVLERKVTQLTNQLRVKDARIVELERLTAEQASEIETMRREIEALRPGK